MTLPAPKNLTIYRGDAWVIKLGLTHKDTGLAQDITGLPILAQVKSNTLITTPPLFEFRVERVDTSGIIFLHLTPDDTKLLNSGTYKYDVQVGDQTVLYGDAIIVPDVSRAL